MGTAVTSVKPVTSATPMKSTVAGANGGSSNLVSSLSKILDSLTKVVQELQQLLAAKGGPSKPTGCSCCGAMSGTQTAVAGASGDAVTGANIIQPFDFGGHESNSYAQQVVDLINQIRAQHGLSQLTYNPTLDGVAQGHDQQMESTNTMAHQGIGDGTPESRIRATGFEGGWGENVAMGQLTPQQVVNEWMASPEHRANILNPTYQQTGVSFGTSAGGTNFWDQEFGT